MNEKTTKNNEFYENCRQYFEFLRKKNALDYDFEDEYTSPCLQYLVINSTRFRTQFNL